MSCFEAVASGQNELFLSVEAGLAWGALQAAAWYLLKYGAKACLWACLIALDESGRGA